MQALPNYITSPTNHQWSNARALKRHREVPLMMQSWGLRLIDVLDQQLKVMHDTVAQPTAMAGSHPAGQALDGTFADIEAMGQRKEEKDGSVSGGSRNRMRRYPARRLRVSAAQRREGAGATRSWRGGAQTVAAPKHLQRRPSGAQDVRLRPQRLAVTMGLRS